jgi:hypothetical protein
MNEKMLTCAFCAAQNPAGTARCLACGAPIEIPVTPPYRVTVVEDTPPLVTPANSALDPAPVSEQLKDGLTAVGAGLGVMGIVGFIFRTLAEALAIAISAAIVGYCSGSMNRQLHGPIMLFLIAAGGGALIGLAVGSVIKRGIFVILSAPFGTLLGVVIALILNLNKPMTPWYPLCGLVGGVSLALLGGHPNATGRFRVYQRLRPWLGLIGGALFGMLGYAIWHRIY